MSRSKAQKIKGMPGPISLGIGSGEEYQVFGTTAAARLTLAAPSTADGGSSGPHPRGNFLTSASYQLSG